jgi:3-oxoacyl-[acyl-carrier protein] reductase
MSNIPTLDSAFAGLSLAGKRALVTGASRGIGAATARLLARRGAAVAINYVSSDGPAQKLLEELTAQGHTAVLAKFDVGDPAAVNAGLESAVKALGGPVEILVNNAAGTKDGLLAMQSEADWKSVFNTNLYGPYHMIKASLRGMVSLRGGRIISLVSPAVLIGNVGQTNYAATKGGLIGITRSLCREVGRYGITVNAVAPGLIDTDLVKSLPAETRKAMIAGQPVLRFGQPEEIAELIAWIASPAASFMTGQVVNLDGGLVMT